MSVLEMITSHFLHWSVEHFVWDALAFVVLGVACARRDLHGCLTTLVVAIFAIPLAVMHFAPEVAVYRGLSGLDSALFALLLVQMRSRLALLCGIAFAAKIAFELTTGSALFAANMGEGVVAVPVAHIAGALVGLCAGTAAHGRPRRPGAAGATLVDPCASSSPCSSH
ncbi:MAG TPA: rhomboid family intramembrane serine protease [Thermoanaerobaculia bacterium]|nr:rhomboid family intramembrane serine protease [Thermoanaerobaculia bacterium]